VLKKEESFDCETMVGWKERKDRLWGKIETIPYLARDQELETRTVDCHDGSIKKDCRK
jgi:hypothetical protein